MKFLNNKYLYLLLLWSVCGMFVSCGNDPIDYQAALTPLTDAGPELTFGTNNTKLVSLQPNDPTTDVISVYRGKADAATTYSIVVLKNDENVFTVPQTVSFEAGSNKADITISYNNADIEKNYKLELGLEEADKDKYSAYTNFVYELKPVWVKLGTGQWIDEVFWAWKEVVIEKHVDKALYRVKNPYTKEWLEGDLMDYWAGYGGDFGKTREYLEFALTDDGYVTWEDPIYVNLTYYGDDFVGYYPSKYNSKYTSYDKKSFAVFKEDGDIAYFEINPCWDAGGEWGVDYYWLYLSFPGTDYASEWENQ